MQYFSGSFMILDNCVPLEANGVGAGVLFFFLFFFFFISWRLITLQYYSGFCHTLTRISHVDPWCLIFMCVNSCSKIFFNSVSNTASNSSYNPHGHKPFWHFQSCWRVPIDPETQSWEPVIEFSHLKLHWEIYLYHSNVTDLQHTKNCILIFLDKAVVVKKIFVWLCRVLVAAWGILVLWPGIERRPSAMDHHQGRWLRR